MGDFDYSTKPQMPQFREEGGGWDWRQLADMFIPGNVWNSRTNQYRPLGIAQGLTGIPVDTLYGAARGAGSFLGSIGRGNLFRRGGPTMPNFASSFGRIGYDAANSPFRNRDLINRENSSIVNQTRNTVSDINDFRGGASRAERGESPIGLGQLGRAGDEAMLYYSQAMRNRNGTQQEL